MGRGHLLGRARRPRHPGGAAGTPRLAALFVRSRATRPALAELAAIAGLATLLVAWRSAAPLAAFLPATLRLAPAVVLGAAVGSPFGEAERTASRPLSLLRLGHLAVLPGCSAVALLAIGIAAPGDGAIPTLLGNGAGLVGLGLVGARLLGAGLVWAAPLAYFGIVAAGVVRDAPRDAWRLWLLPEAPTVPARAIAVAALLAGVALVVAAGARDVPDETG